MKNNKLSADEKEYQEYLAREAKLMDSEAKLRESEEKAKQFEEKAKQSEEKAKQSEEKVRNSEEKVEKLIKELLKAGISQEVISINTGLDIDEINKIKEGLDKR